MSQFDIPFYDISVFGGVMPRFFFIEKITAAVYAEYRREYSELHPSNGKFIVFDAVHMSTDIMTPPTETGICRRCRKIRLKMQSVPCRAGIA